MESTNLVRRMKELINIIKEADVAYFVNDNPTMSDNEYDKLVAELKGIEHETGIVFSDSPSKRVGGNVKEELKSVTHTKPMLSAKKTKCIGDVLEFAANKDVIVSWKLDGLTIVLRYENGELKQAITRGKDGLIGEDVTHTVKHFRNVPLKVPCKDSFEVRGEGVCSWSDFEIIKKNEGSTHPRNVAAGTVRTLTADEGKLSHLDFVAFELIDSNKDWNSKLEQLEFLENNKFSVVENSFVRFGSDDIESEIGKYNPDTYFYPVDGVVIEYEDLKYGKSLGATAHHENRLIALKWEDAEYETIFRGVELATGRTGTVEINAIFDPVDIGGMMVRRANVHGLSGF
jgi:DNA ligase (NAD+)